MADQQREDAWLEVLHPDDRLAAGEAWKTALFAGIIYDITYRVRSKLGGWSYVRVRGCPILEKDGSVREWVGTLDDVTVQFASSAEAERLHAEACMEKRRLEEVFHHAPSFIAVLRGPNHVFERINDRYSQLIGGRTVIGLPVREALPEVTGQGYFELLDRVYQTGVPHTEVNANLVLNHPEGPVNRTLEFVYQPMFDSKSKVTGVIVQGIDLTARRNAEQGLIRVSAERDTHTFAGFLPTLGHPRAVAFT